VEKVLMLYIIRLSGSAIPVEIGRGFLIPIPRAINKEICDKT